MENDQTGVGETVEDAIAPEPTPIAPTSSEPTSAENDSGKNQDTLPSPNYDEFPHQNERAIFEVKKSRAEYIKQDILAIESLDDYFRLKDHSDYTRDELNWVLKQCLTQKQRDNLKALLEASESQDWHTPESKSKIIVRAFLAA